MNKHGFTLAEVLVAIAIGVILSGIAIVSFYNLNREQSLEDDVRSVTALLDLARTNAVSAKGDYAYGVLLSSTTVRVFRTTSGLTSDYSDTYPLSPRNTLLNINLLSGQSYIIFSKNTGFANTSGSFDIVARGASSSKQTILIYKTGLAEKQN